MHHQQQQQQQDPLRSRVDDLAATVGLLIVAAAAIRLVPKVRELLADPAASTAQWRHAARRITRAATAPAQPDGADVAADGHPAGAEAADVAPPSGPEETATLLVDGGSRRAGQTAPV